MIVRSRVSWGGIFQSNCGMILLMLAYVSLVTAAEELGYIAVNVPVAIPGVLGTALSILLGFRTNSAYNRWWEARQIWGGIVNDSRTFARQVLTLLRLPVDAGATPGGVASLQRGAMASLQREMVYRQIAFNYTLCHDLRGQDGSADIEGLLSAEEREALEGQDNRHAALLHTQGMRLAAALSAGYLDDLRLLPIEDTLTRFSNHMGQCERIKNTPMPLHYSFFVTRIAWLFFLLLPFSLAAPLGWLAIPVGFIVGFVFLLIDVVATYLQDPFDGRVTDTPTFAISRTIDRNLRQQLGERSLPPRAKPVDGVLM